MSSSSRHCPACGAHLLSQFDRVCGSCGATLEAASPLEGAPSEPLATEETGARERESDRPRLKPRERLAALRASPRLREALGRRPSARPAVVGHVAAVVFGAVFLSLAIFLWLRFREFGAQAGGGVPGILTYVPLIFVAAGAWILVFNLARAIRVGTAPLEALPAVVVGTRTATSVSRGRQRMVHHHHFVTIEVENGDRSEHPASSRLVGLLRQDDAGVAYVKAGNLIDFVRIEA